ncbi:hypothetical protein Goarm_022532 [Gossypium armourianum]|uniref:Uncharacterized protein n=1 Tax=Gossypium armourianum TaxID=34283 RepID=A0A7J9KFS4_9ROSI|nr:hypothetical protein [Gossypium armourianum]
MRSRGADLSAITSFQKVPKRGLFPLLSFAAFNEDDDYNFFLGGGVEGTDDEEDDSDDEYLDFYDDIHDGDGDYNDDSDNDDGDYDSEDVESGDDDDCNDDGDNDDVTTPQDLMLQLFSLQRRGTSPEQIEENASAVDRELLEFILTFNANSGASSDDGGNGPEDPFC